MILSKDSHRSVCYRFELFQLFLFDQRDHMPPGIPQFGEMRPVNEPCRLISYVRTELKLTHPPRYDDPSPGVERETLFISDAYHNRIRPGSILDHTAKLS